MDVVTLISLCLTSGGFLYLIIDKLLLSKKEKADIQSVQVDNANKIADFYDQVDEIIRRKTEPLEKKLDKALKKIDYLDKYFCCRMECTQRQRED